MAAPATTLVVPRPASDLLAQARAGLAEAEHLTDPGERYAAAHLAALRVAAAVLSARAAARRRGAPRSAWDLLPRVAPELAEWAAFFAAGARKRTAAEAGIPGAATAREADDLVRDAAEFGRIAAGVIAAGVSANGMNAADANAAGPSAAGESGTAHRRHAPPA